jgi:hypothetical protein
MSNKIVIVIFGIFAAFGLLVIGLFALLFIRSRAVSAETEIVPTRAPLVPTLAMPQPDGASSLSLGTLENAQYHSPTWGDCQLSGGIFYRTPATSSESAENYATRLFMSAFGDLDGDGNQDAAVILQTKNGGNGDNKELAAMLNQNGAAYNVATLDLGFPVAVESLQIEQGGVIALHVLTLGPNDGLCCPSQKEFWQFHLENNQLVRLP